jgi:CheY-like chemotaxis protein
MARGNSLSGKTILVVEDNFLVAQDLQEMVSSAKGSVCKPAHSVAKALATLASQPVDGVLLDAKLHDGSSTDIARDLARRHIPFIVVTGYARRDLAPELQAAPYLAKPFGREELVALAAHHFVTGA